MKMEYKLLNSNNGVIMTRAPELIGDMLYISFTGAPDKATAIFERSDGESAYRALSDGLCGIESDWLDGSMKVTVAVLDGSVRAQRWFCEGFYARHIKECGGVLVYPDDMDMLYVYLLAARGRFRPCGGEQRTLGQIRGA